jgi:hypothetical protein
LSICCGKSPVTGQKASLPICDAISTANQLLIMVLTPSVGG